MQDGEDIVFVMVNSVVRIKHYREELCLDANTYNVPHYKTQQMFKLRIFQARTGQKISDGGTVQYS